MMLGPVDSSSNRLILRSTMMIGASSFINIGLNLARTKVAAVVLGPAGIGLIGLLQNVMSSAALVSNLGLNVSGTRQISAATAGGDIALAPVRRALEWGTFALALLAGLIVWLGRELIASRLLGDATLATSVGYIAIGVTLSVVGSVQFAVLSGYRQTANLARSQVWSALASAILGVSILLAFGEAGLIWFILVSPVATVLVGRWYIGQLPWPSMEGVRHSMVFLQFRLMVVQGLPLMASALVMSVGQLAARIMVQRDVGVEGLGQFQAAWLISLTYVNFILNALVTDYYPRLSVLMAEKGDTGKLISQQQEMALLISGPVLLFTMAIAPQAITLLYSAAFDQSATILRWQILGDMLKVAIWPLSYALIAAGAGRLYLLSESVGMAVYLLALSACLSRVGVEGAGIAYAAMYAGQILLVLGLVRARVGFRLRRTVAARLGVLLVLASAILAAAQVSAMLAAVGGLAATALVGIEALVRMQHLGDIGGPAGKVAALARRFAAGIGIRLGNS